MKAGLSRTVFPNYHRNTLAIVDDFSGFQYVLQRGKVFFKLFLSHFCYDGVNQLEEPACVDQGKNYDMGAAVEGLETIGSLQLDRSGNCFEAITFVCFELCHFKVALDTPPHEVTKTTEYRADLHVSIRYLHGF